LQGILYLHINETYTKLRIRNENAGTSNLIWNYQTNKQKKK